MTTGAQFAGITEEEMAQLKVLAAKGPHKLTRTERVLIKQIATKVQTVLTQTNSTSAERASIKRLINM